MPSTKKILVFLLLTALGSKFTTKGLLIHMMRPSKMKLWKQTWPKGVVEYLSASYITPAYGKRSIYANDGFVGLLFDMEDPNIAIHGGNHYNMFWQSPHNEKDGTEKWVLKCKHVQSTNKHGQRKNMFLDKKYERVLISANKIPHRDVTFLDSKGEMVRFVQKYFAEPVADQPQTYDFAFDGFTGGKEKNEIKISTPFDSIAAVLYVEGELETHRKFAENLKVPLVKPVNDDQFEDFVLIEDYSISNGPKLYQK